MELCRRNLHSFRMDSHHCVPTNVNFACAQIKQKQCMNRVRKGLYYTRRRGGSRIFLGGVHSSLALLQHQ